ncbi:MAG: PEGA domain-containing protein [Myxococcota bacterium]|nr:PEGA domain-containing protein [Myxococcota bacterium]
MLRPGPNLALTPCRPSRARRERRAWAVPGALAPLLAVALSLLPARAEAWESLDVPAMLRRPGVKLVAVDFYATWCPPCIAAIPKWKALQERYRSRGLRLIVVSVRSERACTDPGWVPDQTVCDEEGRIQEQWEAGSLPQAFLWSWQGQLLAAHATAEQVEARIEEYFRTTPRIAVDTPRTRNGQAVAGAKALRGLVQAELNRSARFDLVASKAELKRLVQEQRRLHGDLYDEEAKCKLGAALPPNSLLKVFVDREGRPGGRLGLELVSLETGCLLSSAHAPLGTEDAPAVAEAVDKLLQPLVGALELPGQAVGAGDPAPRQQPLPAGKGRLVLRSTPPGATVWLGRAELGRCGPGGVSVALDPGRHGLRFQLPGHQDKRAEAEVVAGAEREVSVALVPVASDGPGDLDASGQPGVLAVRSTPPRARILVDGQDTGKLTDTNLRLPPGRYVLQVTKDLYLPGPEKVLDLRAGDMVVHEETLTANFGELHVASRPPGAEVLIDGQTVGKTPLHRPQQTAGRLRITLRYPLHLEASKEVELARGGKLELSETLTPAYGTFEIVSVPPGADVLLDGRPVGQTPATLREVPLGQHRLALQLHLHERLEAPLTVAAGDTRTLRYELAPDYGTLTVAEPGQPARVWLDDQDLGPPQAFRVPPGPHVVEVRPADARYRPHRESVAVPKGGAAQVTPTLPPRTGGLLITTEPAGAHILVDGQPQAGEPVKLDSLLVGRHRLRAEQAGYSSTEQTVEVAEGKLQTVVLALSTKGGLEVVSTPPGAAVRVADRPAQPAPVRVGGLDAGSYPVRCALAGHLPQEQTVAVRDGEVTRVECRLTTRNFLAEARTSKRRWGTVALVASLLAAGAGGYGLYVADGKRTTADDRYAEYLAEPQAKHLDVRYEAVEAAVGNQRGYAALGWGGLGAAAALLIISIYEYASMPAAAPAGSGGETLVPLLLGHGGEVGLGVGGSF